MPGEGKGKTAPARLFVHLAREAPVGVVLRRGPTDWVQIILWHTDTDTFEYGQWFHGGIKERVCDISPDGSMFVYFATDYRREIPDAPHTLAFMWKWTAISRPPYLTALALWPNFDHRFFGGGFFVNNKMVYLYGEETETLPGQGSVPPDMAIVRVHELNEKGVDWPDQTSLNGWTVTQERIWQYPPGKALKPQVMRKDQPLARYSVLQKTPDFYRYHYCLLENGNDIETNLADVTWADFDQRGRIAYAKQGKLFGVDPGASIDSAHEIADFNDQRFTRMIAPEWAQHW